MVPHSRGTYSDLRGVMCLRIHNSVRSIELQMVIAGNKILKAQHHNTFCVGKEMLCTHTAIEILG